MMMPIARFRRPVLAVLLAATLAAQPGRAEDSSMGEPARNDVKNVASLQRGARNFANYCMGCHSAKYVRFNRLGQDLQIPDALLVEDLMFAAQKPQETINIAMRPEDARRWFGIEPPDLSLIARNRGANYLYNFLRGFYLDPTRPTGVNNIMLPNAAMPHVLWELQGLNEAVFEDVSVDGGAAEKTFREFRQVTPGKLSPEEYDRFVRDIVDFLVYIGEPMQLERRRLGMWVLGFLLVFGILAYLLKQEIWKDVK